MSKIAISGTRNDLSDPQKEVIDKYMDHYKDHEFILGDAKGVDAYVKSILEGWGQEEGRDFTVHYADWDKLGCGAGPARNAKMIEHAEYLIAFPVFGTKGTKDCIGKAYQKGIPYITFRL